MGNKCSKNQSNQVSENLSPEAFNDLENRSNSLKSNATNPSLLGNLSHTNTEEHNLSHFNSSKSNHSALDSGFMPGVLPFENGSISIENNTQLSFKEKNSALFNETAELNKSFNSTHSLSSHGTQNLSNHSSFHEFDNANKQNSLLNSRNSFASTNDSDYDDNGVEMRTYTPFDMKRTDELAKFLVTQCGLGLSNDHNPLNCQICQTVDLSDAPLIA